MSQSQTQTWLVLAGPAPTHPTTNNPMRITRIFPWAAMKEARELAAQHSLALFKANSRREAREILAGERTGDDATKEVDAALADQQQSKTDTPQPREVDMQVVGRTSDQPTPEPQRRPMGSERGQRAYQDRPDPTRNESE